MILVTGCAGFIGSNFVHLWLSELNELIVNLDKLTYAGNANNLSAVETDERYRFVHGDIGDRSLVAALLLQQQPRAIINFAAESHVDRSIHGPTEFIQTNVVGTFNLLECVRAYWTNLPPESQRAFRFVHVSTDEVYGSLSPEEPRFRESDPYRPNSPYSASKAGSDHLARAWHHTYGLPIITTNCSNNYGPYQFPEKLVPLIIHHALVGEALPIYGDGTQVRDWLYVEDHCRALLKVVAAGQVGATYNIGGGNERSNLDTVRTICQILDEVRPREGGVSYAEQITFVKDRPGHDRRYAIDATKIQQELGWQPQETFETGIRRTIAWYLNNPEWVEQVVSGGYRQWLSDHYGG